MQTLTVMLPLCYIKPAAPANNHPFHAPKAHLCVHLSLVSQHLGQVVDWDFIAIREPELCCLVTRLLHHTAAVRCRAGSGKSDTQQDLNKAAMNSIDH